MGPATFSDKDQNTPFNPAAFSYNIPLDNANTNKPVSNKKLINIFYYNYIYSSRIFELICDIALSNI